MIHMRLTLLSDSLYYLTFYERLEVRIRFFFRFVIANRIIDQRMGHNLWFTHSKNVVH